uniref:Uncharacterized protein n=1 Tax=Arundo donax TaxID=35708 RepID=A0A0A9CE88_ARUDO
MDSISSRFVSRQIHRASISVIWVSLHPFNQSSIRRVLEH